MRLARPAGKAATLAFARRRELAMRIVTMTARPRFGEFVAKKQAPDTCADFSDCNAKRSEIFQSPDGFSAVAMELRITPSFTKKAFHEEGGRRSV